MKVEASLEEIVSEYTNIIGALTSDKVLLSIQIKKLERKVLELQKQIAESN